MINTIMTPKDAVDELYTHGKVCVTAHKEVNIDAKYRPYLALFADGSFLVDERAQDDVVLQNLVFDFYKEYPSQKRLNKQYVSPQMLKAVYHRAQDFEWYLPQYNIPTDLSTTDRKNLHNFLERILQRQCLSITTLTTPEWFRFYSPDKEKFALFGGEQLVVAQNSPHINKFLCNISKLYPQIEVVEIVPEYYIYAIYEKLLYMQASAREIYINLMLQKLMQRLKINSDEALKIMKKQTRGWRRLLFMSEKQARSMIYSEYVEKFFIQTDTHFATLMAEKKELNIGIFL
ncbi:MAG: hypothetical protein IJ677_07250 [Alphaproteobacteria bacterium]|nr:hypothetical protein [Alphaproteobacteria bacterium]